jgi:hypothetical protein
VLGRAGGRVAFLSMACRALRSSRFIFSGIFFLAFVFLLGGILDGGFRGLAFGQNLSARTNRAAEKVGGDRPFRRLLIMVGEFCVPLMEDRLRRRSRAPELDNRSDVDRAVGELSETRQSKNLGWNRAQIYVCALFSCAYFHVPAPPQSNLVVR